MSPGIASSVLTMTGATLTLAATVLAFRDRDRRERTTGTRPQPLEETAVGRVLRSLALAAMLGAAILLFV